MYPTIPVDLAGSMAQSIIYVCTAVAAFWSILLTPRGYC